LDLIGNLPAHPEALDKWNEIIRWTAWETLDEESNQAGTNALALKATVRARGILAYFLKELFPEPEEEVTA
jgi:hypothetical protein